MNNQQTENQYYAHPTAIVDEGCVIGKGSKIWHFSHVMPNSEMGENCILGQNVLVSPRVKLGNNVKVQNNVSIYTGVICEDDTFLGPSMVFTNVINPRSFLERKNEFRTTLVKKGASIGANATVICGVTLGAYCLIGAGAVVTKDVPDFALVVGNPARHLGWVSRYGHRLHFDNDGVAACRETGERYQLEDDRVRILDVG